MGKIRVLLCSVLGETYSYAIGQIHRDVCCQVDVLAVVSLLAIGWEPTLTANTFGGITDVMSLAGAWIRGDSIY